MKIGIAQTKPVTGDISRNIQHHQNLIDQAAGTGVGILIFPELSLTGYEPTLAHSLAVHIDDNRLNVFQQLSDSHQMIIGAGIPTRHGEQICISMVIFQPHQPRQLYSKKYLHADEEPFFVTGQHGTNRLGEGIALAICYEITIQQHVEEAFADGAKIYIASVAKSLRGINKALERLSQIANKYAMTVLMSNAVGQADGEECAGKSSIWNNNGELLAQLDGLREGILILDTDTARTSVIY
jgi:predicted amidohydrolase